MLKSDYAGQNCSVARALEAVGERWTLLIVRELLRKPSRFSTLESRLGVSKNILSTRLDKLIAIGVIETVVCDPARGWSSYQLTPKGEDLFPVIVALMAWGDAHDAPHGAPAYFEHTCGRAAGHRLVCEACGESVDAHSVRGRTGPAWDLAHPAQTDASRGRRRTIRSAPK